MLRQVFIYYKNEVIFQYFFAKAFDKEILEEIVLKKRLISYITNPIENKILNKPLLDFQTHFVFSNGIFFLFVTDMADRPKLIAKEVDRASKLFIKNFPDPLKIKDSSPEKEEFTIFIKETHYYLHPKISLVGPIGAGKSTIVDILNQKKSHGKKIMDFAFYFRVQLGDIFFDLWDFIARDDFSPLWNNFTRGSDNIFFVIDGSNLNDEKVKFFINLKRREGKYSNWAIILTHSDNHNFLNSSSLKEKFEFLKNVEIFEINLIDQNALGNLSKIFIKTLGLKEALPPEFRSKLIQANNFVAEANFAEGIAILKELIRICEMYQEFAYLEVFQNKIKELEEKLQLQTEKKKLEEDMFRAPEKVQFKDFKGVSNIPGQKTGVPMIKKLPISNLEPKKGFNDPAFSKLDDKNPFFSDIKPKKAGPIEEMPPGAPIQDFEIKIHRIKPINIDKLSEPSASSRIKMKEKFLESSLSNYKSGQTRDKKLTLERSPLVSKSVRAQSITEIRKIKLVSSKVEKNPLGNFILQPELLIPPISVEAEKLGEQIRNLGESLSRTLCLKFVEQLRIRLNKTNLTDDDIIKAARLYVSQRRKRD